MDGMLYRRETGSELEIVAPKSEVPRLLLITVVASVCVLVLMLSLRCAGVDMTLPSDFSFLIPGEG